MKQLITKPIFLLSMLFMLIFIKSLSPNVIQATEPGLCALQGYCEPICGQPYGSIPCIYTDCGFGTELCYKDWAIQD